MSVHPSAEPGDDVAALLEAVLACDSPADRAAALAGCDPAVREEVEALAAAHDGAGSFLGNPLVDAAAFDRTRAEAPTAGDVRTDPESVDTLGPYRLLETVGRGGMGIVRRAEDPHLNRTVAVKMLAPEFAAHAVARRRFAREARAAAAVSHPHVVTIHAVEPDGPVPYLVMEYVAGRSLREKLEAEGALELTETLRIGSQIARGLAAAHAQGLIHRDVKPGNVLLENGVERVKLTDFGLARATADAAITRTGDIAGTPQYMSPEQAEGQPVDHRADLFSLGGVLYALCTGRPPFRGDTAVAVLRKVCDKPARPVRDLNPDVPEWLADVVARLLAKDPADRFQTAAEVADLLGDRLAALQNPGSVVRPARSPEARPPEVAAPKRSVRPPARWATAAAVLAAVLAGVGVTDAAGVTDVVPTVVRLVRGDGTLVVRTADPDVGVSIEGEDLVITGAGTGEIRLQPGTYTVKATKDGKPAFRELVTVERNGREVVNVRWEPTAVKSAGEADTPRLRLPPIDKNGRLFDWDAAMAEADREDARPELTLVRTFEGHTGPAKELAYSPDGTRVASGSGWPDGDRTARVWDAATGKQLKQFAHPSPVWSVAWSPDGTQLLTGAKDGLARLWDVERGEVVREYAGAEVLLDVAFSPDGKRIIGCDSNGRVVLVWDTGENELLHTLKHGGQEHQLLRAVVTPDGKHVLAANRGGQVLVWNLGSGEFERALPEQTPPHRASVGLAVVPGTNLVLAGAHDGVVHVWDLKTGEEVLTAETELTIQDIDVSPDGRLALVAGGGGQPGQRGLAAFDTETGAVLFTESFDGGFLWNVAFAPASGESDDGREFLTAGGNRWVMAKPYPKTVPTGDNALKLWRLPDPSGEAATVTAAEFPALTLERELEGHTGPVKAVAVSPDGTLAASGSGWPQGDGEVRIWDVKTGGSRLPLPINKPVKALAFAPDGETFVIAGAAGQVRLWKTDKGATDDYGTIGPTFESGSDSIDEIVFTPDGTRVVAVSGANGAVLVWDVETGKLIGNHPQPEATFGVAVTPDGLRAAVTQRSGPVRLIHLEDGRLVRTFEPPKLRGRPTAYTVAVSPDGSVVAAGYKETVVRLWNLEAGGVLTDLHTRQWNNERVAFADEGNLLFTAGPSGGPDSSWREGKGAVTVFDLDAVEPVAAVDLPVGHGWAMAVTRDGRRVLTGGGFYAQGGWSVTDDFKLRLWALPKNSGRAAAPTVPREVKSLVALAEAELAGARTLYEQGIVSDAKVIEAERALVEARIRAEDRSGGTTAVPALLRKLVRLAERDLERAERLFEDGLTSSAEFLQAERAVAEARLRLAEAVTP